MSKIIEILVAELRPHPDNAKWFCDIEGERWEHFRDNIAENGILQPLLVAADDTGYTVLSGHQRLRAARALDLEAVPCVVWAGGAEAGATLDVLIGANLGRTLSTLEQYRMTIYLLDKADDRRERRERTGGGAFSSSKRKSPNSNIHLSAQSGPLGGSLNPAGESLNSNIYQAAQSGLKQKLRDHVAAMVPGVTKHDIETFRRISQLPEPVQIELFRYVDKHNPNKRQLKDKVNALASDKRRLKAQLREATRIKQTKREMAQMRDYLAAEVDPAERHEARTFDAINTAINTACAEISTLVAAVFAAGPVRERTARRLAPGITALAEVLTEQRAALLDGWRDRSRDLDDIDRRRQAIESDGDPDDWSDDE